MSERDTAKNDPGHPFKKGLDQLFVKQFTLSIYSSEHKQIQLSLSRDTMYNIILNTVPDAGNSP